MAASRVLALVRSAGLAKLIPPLSSFEYAVGPLAMDVCEIRRPSHHQYRSSSTIRLPTPGLETLPSDLRCSGLSPNIHHSDATFSLIGDEETDWFNFLRDLDSISAEFVSSLGQGFNLGNPESEKLSPVLAEFAEFVIKTLDSDHAEVFIHHWLLMCAPSGSTEEGPSSNGPDDQEPNPSDEGPNHGEDSDKKGSEDLGKSKDKKDDRIECDCARTINGSSCLKKCCYDLKFELQKRLYDLDKVKEVLRVQKVTNEAKGDFLDQKIRQVREEMKDLQMLKQLAQLLQTDIEARKTFGERKENSHQDQQNEPHQQKTKDSEEQQNESHQEKAKDSHQEEEEKKWKKWKMALKARGVLALVVLKRQFPKTPKEALGFTSDYFSYLNALYFLGACYIILSQEELSESLKQLMIVTLYTHEMKKESRLKYYNEQKILANKWWAEKQKKKADGNSS